MSESWDDQWQKCPNCGKWFGRNVPGCPSCTHREMRKEGHYGFFSCTEGWVCYRSCPKCAGE